jgi:hypothetical protein
MKRLLLGVITIFMILFVSSCYYDKEDLLYGNANAACTDTTSNISYAQHIVPMLRQYCYNCHLGGFPSGGIAMGTYATDKAIAQNGKLYGSISHAGGFIPMPQGMSKFTNCQIQAVKKWIDAGMLNN